MKTLKELRQARGVLVDEMEEINKAAAEDDDRDLTKDEQKRWEEIEAELADLDKRIARAETLEREQARNAAPVDTPAAPLGNRDGLDGEHGRYRFPADNYERHVKGFGHGREAHERAYRAGMWALAALYGVDDAREWCRENGLALQQSRAQSGTTGTAGGFLVPDEMASAIIDLRERFGVFRNWMSVRSMASDHIMTPRRTGGLTAYAVGDNQEITESEKAWDQVELTARKWGVLVRYSSEIDEDAIIDMASDLASEIAYAFATTEDDAAANGDGTSTYHGIRGILTKINDGNHAGSIYTAASGVDTLVEVTTAELTGTMAKLPQYALPNAAWYCSQVAYSLVFERLAQAAGGVTMAETAGGFQPRYMGYPIKISQKLPTSTGDLSDLIMLFFGDMMLSSTMGDRRRFTLKSSAERYLEFDQLAIQGTTRFDIVHHDLGDGTVAGPIIGLKGN